MVYCVWAGSLSDMPPACKMWLDNCQASSLVPHTVTVTRSSNTRVAGQREGWKEGGMECQVGFNLVSACWSISNVLITK
jgi:hypothetical protein